jgi:hypothetical protein
MERAKLTVKMLEKIDWEALTKQMSRVIGMPVVFTTKAVGVGGRLLLKSENLVEYVGILQSVFEKVTVGNFGGECYVKDGKKYLWIPVHFTWYHKGGGTNGTGIMDATWDFKAKSWTFRERLGQ